MILAASSHQRVKEAVADIAGAKAIDNQLDGHTALCRADQRGEDFFAGRVISEHIEKHADGLRRRTDQVQYGGEPVFGRMNKMQVMACNLKMLSREFRGHVADVVAATRNGKPPALCVDIWPCKT